MRAQKKTALLAASREKKFSRVPKKTQESTSKEKKSTKQTRLTFDLK